MSPSQGSLASQDNFRSQGNLVSEDSLVLPEQQKLASSLASSLTSSAGKIRRKIDAAGPANLQVMARRNVHYQKAIMRPVQQDDNNVFRTLCGSGPGMAITARNHMTSAYEQLAIVVFPCMLRQILAKLP